MMTNTENTCYFIMSLIGKNNKSSASCEALTFFGKHLVCENSKSSTTSLVKSPGVRKDIIT